MHARCNDKKGTDINNQTQYKGRKDGRVSDK